VRLTPSQLRMAVTDPNYRLPTTKAPPAPSTDGSLRKAIRFVHEVGPEAAIEQLRQSLSGEYWRDKGKTKARMARLCLDNYIALAEGDRRPWAPGLRMDVVIGDDIVAAGLDAVIIADEGYWGRLLVPGPLAKPLTQEEREILACPGILALIRDIEGGFVERPVLGMEVWELRSRTANNVRRVEAETALPRLVRLLNRLR